LRARAAWPSGIPWFHRAARSRHRRGCGEDATGAVDPVLGFDHAKYGERRAPSRADLDRATSRHPVAVSHISGHYGWSARWSCRCGASMSPSPTRRAGIRPGTRWAADRTVPWGWPCPLPSIWARTVLTRWRHWEPGAWAASRCGRSACRCPTSWTPISRAGTGRGHMQCAAGRRTLSDAGLLEGAYGTYETRPGLAVR